MSNISFITTRKYIKSYDMVKLLNMINNKRFGGKLLITQGYEGGLEKQDKTATAWKIGHKDCWDYLWIHQDGARKLACKWPHDPWMSYVHVVFQEELGALTKGTLSDEGVSEHWKPKPRKYTSYVAWINLLHMSAKRSMEPDQYKAIILDVEMRFVPKGLESY